MSKRLTSFVTNHPYMVIFVAILFVIGAGYGAKNLVFKSDYRIFFGKDNPQLIAYDAMQKIYNKSDSVSFVVAPNDGQVFTQNHLEGLQFLTEQGWQVPFSTRVDSITNFQHSYAEEDDMIVEDLIDDPANMTEAQLAIAKRFALDEPMLIHKLISPNAHVSVVNVTVQLPGENPVVEMPLVSEKVREIQAAYLKMYPNNKVYLSGMVMMNTSFSEATKKDSATLIPMMFGVVILTIGILLRTITGTITTVLIIISSIVATMGIAGWTGFYLTGPSAGAPTMILTLAVADCIHILATMYYEMRHGMKKKQAILESLRVNMQPIFLTSLTTAIGFLSMNFSDSPPFNDLGNLVAIGVMLAFVFSITFFPAMLSVLPIRVRVQEDKTDWLLKLSGFVIRKRKILLPTMAIIIIGFVTILPRNELNDDFVKYFDKTVPFRQATDFMQENLSGMALMEVSIDTKQTSGINDPAFIANLGEFTDWLRTQPETDHVMSLSDTLKRLNMNMHADDPDWYRLPENKELAAQYLLLYEMSLPYGLDLNNQINVDKSSVRMIVTFQNVTSNEMIELETRMKSWMETNAPAYETTVAGPSLMFAHIGQRNINSMLVGIVFALVLISLLLGIALKSVKYGLISLLPNIAPAAVGFGIWYLLDGQIGLSLSVVAGMTLGIVVDDTVHFMSKYLHARRNRNADSHQAVEYAFGSVGRALWITTWVLVAGFMVLAQSQFKFNADMGFLTAMTIVIALIIDFLFLPPLLMMLDSSKSKQTTSTLEGEKSHAKA